MIRIAINLFDAQGSRKLLINYFKQHYGNEHRAADNLKRLLLPIVTQWVKTA